MVRLCVKQLHVVLSDVVIEHLLINQGLWEPGQIKNQLFWVTDNFGVRNASCFPWTRLKD